MPRKQTPKSLSVFQQMLKTILVPIIIVALSLMVLLPVFAVLMVQTSSQKTVKQLFSSFDQTMMDMQAEIAEIVSHPTIQGYLLYGENKIGVYEILYGMSNRAEYHPYFYLADITFTKEAIYQPSHSQDADSILNMGNRRRLFEYAGTMLQLTNNRINNQFTPPLVFAQAVVRNEDLLGYLVVDFYPSQIETMIGDINQSVLLLNSQSKIIYSTNSNFAMDTRIAAQYQIGPLVWSGGNIYWLQQHKSTSTDISVVTLLNISFVTQIIQAVLIALLFSSAIAVVVFLLFRKQISKDTFNMLDDMFASLKSYQETGELLPVQVRENSMTDYIEQYNAILYDIQHLADKNQQLMKDTTVAQLKQLQSQFNPHFIFNTLASIQVMIQKDGAAASSMIHKLAAMLRYSIRFGEENRVLLSDDIEYLKDYLSLQKIRFQELLEYEIIIEESDFLIPKLILQPIIENSIQHGFTGDTLFSIQISIYHIKDDLVMIVRDNGCGMSKKKLREIQKLLKEQPENSAHIGLVNCHRRLQLFYGESYGISIDSIEGKGTTIVLTCKAERK